MMFNRTVILAALASLVLLICAPFLAHAQVPSAGRFDFAKRTTVSIGVQREFYQTENAILGQNDQPQWTAGIFGSFRLGTLASVVASQTRGLEHHDWRTTAGLRLTLWRGAKTPLDLQPGGSQ